MEPIWISAIKTILSLQTVFFAVKYNLAESDPLKYGFSLYQTEVGLSSYKNEYATQLAILTEGVYKDVKFTNLTLDNQTRFLNQITGLEQTYFTNSTHFLSKMPLN